MDPFHPLLPIEPAPLGPPDYARVERVAREQQREAAPDWGQSDADAEDGEAASEGFDDAYEEGWTDPTSAAAGYQADGHVVQPPTTRPPDPEWDPARDGERRHRQGGSGDRGSDDGEAGKHIDIRA